MLVMKLQRPLAGGDEVLGYDQMRKHQVVTPMTPELKKMFSHRYKIFAEVSLPAEPTSGLVVHKIVPDRGW